MSITFENRSRIAVVTIDNPSVNAMSRAVRPELWDIAGQIEADDEVKAVAFTGGADTTSRVENGGPIFIAARNKDQKK